MLQVDQAITFVMTITDYEYEAQQHAYGEVSLEYADQEDEILEALSNFFPIREKLIFMKSASHNDRQTRHKEIAERVYGANCIIVHELRNMNYVYYSYQVLPIQGHTVFAARVVFTRPDSSDVNKMLGNLTIGSDETNVAS